MLFIFFVSATAGAQTIDESYRLLNKDGIRNQQQKSFFIRGGIDFSQVRRSLEYVGIDPGFAPPLPYTDTVMSRCPRIRLGWGVQIPNRNGFDILTELTYSIRGFNEEVDDPRWDKRRNFFSSVSLSAAIKKNLLAKRVFIQMSVSGLSSFAHHRIYSLDGELVNLGGPVISYQRSTKPTYDVVLGIDIMYRLSPKCDVSLGFAYGLIRESTPLGIILLRERYNTLKANLIYYYDAKSKLRKAQER
jgi:hypothetical protein